MPPLIPRKFCGGHVGFVVNADPRARARAMVFPLTGNVDFAFSRLRFSVAPRSRFARSVERRETISLLLESAMETPKKPGAAASPFTRRLAFLGVCDQHSTTLDAANIPRQNVLGLRTDVLSHVFPLPIHRYTYVLGVNNPASLPEFDVALVSPNDGSRLMSFKARFQVRNAQDLKPVDVAIGGFQPEVDWFTFMIRPDDSALTLLKAPAELLVVARVADHEEKVGSIRFHHLQAPPLTSERIDAIRANPSAGELVKMLLRCKKCGDEFKTYAALERSEKSDKAGFQWYADLPPRFRCGCGEQDLDLSYLRGGLHGYLGQSTGRREGPVVLEQLYSAETLAALARKFQILLDSNPEEPEVQTFLENNPIFWNMFAPDLIVRKAPILNQYNTDFAILSKTGKLHLIEIEKPSKRLIKKDGGPTQQFNHPFRQVDDWLFETTRHRSACLDAMGVPESSVSHIQGAVVIGRDSQCSPRDLQKLKGAQRGSTMFLTYDDLLKSVTSLISSFQELVERPQIADARPARTSKTRAERKK